MTAIMNDILNLQYVSINWKTAEVIMINKLGNPAHNITTYRYISLLPILSRLMEKLLATRLNNIIKERKLIPYISLTSEKITPLLTKCIE